MLLGEGVVNYHENFAYTMAPFSAGEGENLGTKVIVDFS